MKSKFDCAPDVTLMPRIAGERESSGVMDKVASPSTLGHVALSHFMFRVLLSKLKTRHRNDFGVSCICKSPDSKQSRVSGSFGGLKSSVTRSTPFMSARLASSVASIMPPTPLTMGSS